MDVMENTELHHLHTVCIQNVLNFDQHKKFAHYMLQMKQKICVGVARERRDHRKNVLHFFPLFEMRNDADGI